MNVLKAIRGKRIAGMLLAGAMAVGVSAFAQDADTPAPGGRHHGAGAAQMKEMSDKLARTPDQQKIFMDSMRDEHTKMKALKDDTTVEGKAKRKQAMQIHADAVATRRAALTEDQKPKFDAMQAEMREKMRNRRGGPLAPGGDGDMAPPPPPPPPGA